MSFIGSVDQGKIYTPGYFLAHEECVRETKQIAQNHSQVVTTDQGAKYVPMGAFYTVAKLPVDDAEKFCMWCLTDFNFEGETVMMAPASGFYTTPGIGRDEVRIAYVLKKNDLFRALFVLQKALEAYPGRTI